MSNSEYIGGKSGNFVLLKGKIWK